MKKSLVLLLKGIILAFTAGVTACFLAQFWGNWRAIIWYAVGLFFIWQMWKYFKTPLLEKRLSGHYKVAERVSVKQKLNIIARDIFCMSVFLAALYGIGWFGEWVFGFSARYFELTMLFGFLLMISGVVVYLMIGLLYCIILDTSWKHYFFIWRNYSSTIVIAILLCTMVAILCVVLAFYAINLGI